MQITDKTVSLTQQPSNKKAQCVNVMVMENLTIPLRNEMEIIHSRRGHMAA